MPGVADWDPAVSIELSELRRELEVCDWDSVPSKKDTAETRLSYFDDSGCAAAVLDQVPEFPRKICRQLATMNFFFIPTTTPSKMSLSPALKPGERKGDCRKKEKRD